MWNCTRSKRDAYSLVGLSRTLRPMVSQIRICYKRFISPLGIRGLFLCFLLPVFLFFVVDFFAPLPVQEDYSTLVFAEDSTTILHSFLSKDQKWRIKTELSEINPQLQKMLVFKEDKYFYWHWGVDYTAILRAFGRNIWYNRRTSGASTITMQVARMLDRKPRTYTQKIWEIFRAFQLEFYYSKNEILQMYVNNLPYGSNIEGIKSASLIFFQKKPQFLSLAEITALTIVPNRPNSWEFGKKNQEIREARNKWLKKMSSARIFLLADIQQAIQEPLQVTRQTLPQHITALATDLQKNNPNIHEIYTTLHPEKQLRTQEITQQYVQRLANYNIHNACALVTNNHTNEIIAYIATADFADKKHKGEVNGIKAVRSPGSTLKPFLYGLAMDKGKITPKTMLEDVPMNFGAFSPENFSKDFKGKVNVENALISSLNVPAVQLLENIGTKNLIALLKNLHFSQIEKDEKKLGLSLALGGCGATLEELVSGYSMLANNGNFEPLKYIQTKKDKTKKSKKLSEKTNILSPETCYLISEILAQNQRPDMPTSLLNRLDLPKIAWKTGTSLGRRDAWAIGYTPDITVGVWVGNFTGEGINNLVGAEIATPLLMDIFMEILAKKDNKNANKSYSDNKLTKKNSEWFTAPGNIKVRYVCEESGKVPNDFCENQIIDLHISAVSSAQKCEHLQKIFVSLDNKIRFCQKCMPLENEYKTEYFAKISPALRAFYADEKNKYPAPPPHNPKCNVAQLEGFSPRITSPLHAQSYIIPIQNPPKISLACQVADDVHEVHWFLNGVLYKTISAKENLFFTPQIGKLNITCTDDRGRTSKIWVDVVAF